MDPDDIIPGDGEISHPGDDNPIPGATEYLPLGEPADGDIYIPYAGDDYTDFGATF